MKLSTFASMNNINKRWKGRLINLIFFGLILFFLLNTSAKSWLLRQMINTGIFSAKIEKPVAENSSTPAMPLTFANEDGSIYSTENMRGKVIFINFWASWCPPCRAEMPSLNKMYQKLKGDAHFAFIFVNLDEDQKTGKAYLKDNQFSLPFHRAQGFIPTDIYTGTLPTTVILDKNGSLVMKHTGMANYDSKNFLDQLNSLK